MKEALEISGSLALAGNELLEQRLELGQVLVGAPQRQISDRTRPDLPSMHPRLDQLRRPLLKDAIASDA
jgi:hypothetical protein